MNIILAGDSHGWGQGASGFGGFTDPLVQGGDWRPMPFEPPCFVNLMRDYVNGRTGSSARLLGFEDAALQPQGEQTPRRGALAFSGALRIPFTGRLARVLMRCPTNGARVAVTLDDRPLGIWDTGRERTAGPLGGPLTAHELFALPDLPDTAHTLTLQPLDGATAHFYCLEAYSGPCAVLNAGRGSSDVRLYIDEHVQRYVRPCRPDLVLVEAMAINDWVRVKPTEQFRADLLELLACLQSLAPVVLCTPSPILGEQQRGAQPYEQYVQAVRDAAQQAGVPLADAHAQMCQYLQAHPDTDAFFADDWHVADPGHRIYFEQLRPFVDQALAQAGLV